jgi:hypothetical protein
MSYNFILALDPSGNYTEGKGTTGWCVMDTKANVITLAGSISAKDFRNMESYWQQHLLLINNFHKQYGKRLTLVIEDFILYESKAMSQVNSHMETSKIIGVLQHYCFDHKISYTMQTASLVKKRWADPILLHKNYINKRGKIFYLPHSNVELNRHARDAIRHAVHYRNFKNKGV